MASYWIKYGNSVLHRNGYAVGKSNYDPYNPLGLPPYTIRCKFSAGYVPTMGESQTLVDATENIWDITYPYTYWGPLFYLNSSLLEVLGANTTGVTAMQQMFKHCTSLTSVPLFDTSSVTNMYDMFYVCPGLTSVPLFDTSSVTDMSGMLYECTSLTRIPLFDTSSVTRVNLAFYQCPQVESGALAMYQQLSTQATPPTEHTACFHNCGINTATGAEELAQIPRSWGGTMSE